MGNARRADRFYLITELTGYSRHVDIRVPWIVDSCYEPRNTSVNKETSSPFSNSLLLEQLFHAAPRDQSWPVRNVIPVVT